MLNTKLNAHGGFTPAAVASPECDNPRTGNTSLSRSAQGRFWGTGTVPSTIIALPNLLPRMLPPKATINYIAGLLNKHILTMMSYQ